MGNDEASKINAFYIIPVSQKKDFLSAERLLKVDNMKFPLSSKGRVAST
jgi:hypothetical protein